MFVEPDLAIHPRRLKLETVGGSDIVLAIAVSATSLAYDRGFRAALYAGYIFQERWLVDPPLTRRTFQVCGPRGQSWRRRTQWGPDDALTHIALPGFSTPLSDC